MFERHAGCAAAMAALVCASASFGQPIGQEIEQEWVAGAVPYFEGVLHSDATAYSDEEIYSAYSDWSVYNEIDLTDQQIYSLVAVYRHEAYGSPIEAIFNIFKEYPYVVIYEADESLFLYINDDRVSPRSISANGGEEYNLQRARTEVSLRDSNGREACGETFDPPTPGPNVVDCGR